MIREGLENSERRQHLAEAGDVGDIGRQHRRARGQNRIAAEHRRQSADSDDITHDARRGLQQADNVLVEVTLRNAALWIAGYDVAWRLRAPADQSSQSHNNNNRDPPIHDFPPSVQSCHRDRGRRSDEIRGSAPIHAAPSSALTSRAPSTIAFILPKAASRGRYLRPQSGATMMSSALR